MVAICSVCLSGVGRKVSNPATARYLGWVSYGVSVAGVGITMIVILCVVGYYIS